MDSFNWECPYCTKSQVVTDNNCDVDKVFLSKTRISSLNYAALVVRTIICSNKECLKTNLTISLHKAIYNNHGSDNINYTKVLHSWKLLPESSAKPQPDCVPEVLAQDYYEACKIRDLSPKASATLARRCIQGMIRDFCKISKNRLIDEINELKRLSEESRLPTGVAEDTIDAIDHVRSIGNIGAHFEKDINVIIDVDPGEAQALIELIEMLFEEWYVLRFEREQKLKKIKTIGAQKAELKTLKAKQINEQDNDVQSEEKPASA